jgi:hypothetical protein
MLPRNIAIRLQEWTISKCRKQQFKIMSAYPHSQMKHTRVYAPCRQNACGKYSDRCALKGYLLTYLLTYGAEPFSRRCQLCSPSRTPPAFYGTRRFNTVFTKALHWSLSLAISIQSTLSDAISLRSILILSTHLRLGLLSGLFPVI